jgi:hypothetical protein
MNYYDLNIFGDDKWMYIICSPHPLLRLMKSKKTIWAGHVAYMQNK